MILESQRNPAWSSMELGWGPPGATIGLYGCLETDFSMIAIDTGHAVNPAQLNQIFIDKKIYVPCSATDVDHDCLIDVALDFAFPGEYQTTHVAGFDAAGIARAVASPDTYAILYISTAAVPTHFVIAWSASAAYIADPWTGKVGTLAGYGGPAAVHKTTYVKHVKLVPAPPPAPPFPAPVPTPPPPSPIWTVENDKDVVIGPLHLTLFEAKEAADLLAAAAPGHLFVVEDEEDFEVYATDVVPPPPPPGPTPGPPPQPPPPSFWEALLALIKKLLGGNR